MVTIHRLRSAVLIGMGIMCSGSLLSQSYPTRAIRIITLPPGSGTDFEGRLIAQGISASLGQPVVVENRPGIAGIEAVARAQPDGYTLLIIGPSMWTGPLLQKMSYDPFKDFRPISLTSTEPAVLTAHLSLGVKSVKELIALAKAKPGELNYGATATGGATHLPNELFKSMAGVNIVRVTYKTSGQAMNDLLGGEGKTIHVGFFSPGTVAPHAKSGKVVALAVTSLEPSTLAPGLPTLSSSGLPGYEFSAINATFAPAKTPDIIINRLNQEITRYLRSADAKEKFFAAGSEAIASSPSELTSVIQSYTVKAAKVIKDAGITAE